MRYSSGLIDMLRLWHQWLAQKNDTSGWCGYLRQGGCAGESFVWPLFKRVSNLFEMNYAIGEPKVRPSVPVTYESITSRRCLSLRQVYRDVSASLVQQISEPGCSLPFPPAAVDALVPGGDRISMQTKVPGTQMWVWA